MIVFKQEPTLPSLCHKLFYAHLLLAKVRPTCWTSSSNGALQGTQVS